MTKPIAWKFILTLGIVSLCADLTYESARSITGPFLALLGASGAVVGAAVGFGEFIGYAMRYLFGALADKTKKYWLFTILGYALSLLAAPLLAWAGNWQIAIALIIIERFGKAMRSPARDTMLSYATKHVGRGRGFGVHEALDQVGAVLGPLLISAVLLWKHDYRFSFALLAIPASLALITLILAYQRFSHPENLEPAQPKIHSKGLKRSYWLYLIGVGLIAAGYVDFALIAFHFQKTKLLSAAWIPFFYAIAMAVQGLAALLLGKYFDQKGLFILVIATILAAMFPPLVFLGSFAGALTGMILWGIGLGAQESIMRAHIANLVPPEKRGSGYGLLNLIFGTSWFLGSALMGVLYDINPLYLVLFSVLIQISSIPLLKRSK
ncbi:MAG: MFS transporter [Rhabdochlamydiaceae bacterium]|nr:MFS transporter [Rhabdochlamydiaceae bacterium]